MTIKRIIWLRKYQEKIIKKHRVHPDEVVETFNDEPRFLFVEAGDEAGENLYLALGKTNGGRYLSVFFIYKRNNDVLPISARNMTIQERRRYAKK